MPIKKIKTFIKLNIPAGAATAAPPVGPALGQHGLPIMDFVKAYNERTKERIGNILPVVITVFDDRTFSFITKEPPVAEMIKKALGVEKGSGKAGKESPGSLNKDAVRKIAEAKLPDLNTKNIEAAMKIVEGTARSMGVKIQ
ncbi:50S ribosomal protein L11 [Candidatus Daviesbacteria bacterium RIFCSPLOWO2_02_FULL_40_8]|uniref:Large ribosomal subunit protein uL11 n=1 Tax=Candidatus Daviesbacteria bacterium RIFCSPLOWO2_01_FULL_40_24 TaxID=1797787 RepID=A0A1F5MJF9_9BACT|nr:MAG: 50S ribosomal protein L11 [Candidatus Daviesbacteria bacterium RIFCSPHIGHO2_01_FULL_41_45]OGE35621.1 MAG: 50S ribosomal protein L11 [Candidatus Daviesbacteria bacterium RIFCSPHIGHO2_02_FULL_41_14]OGE65501.1 MAG: 50S ribosomal protein L11 [Candidatus Daviesbacteria bacterium RIFCSPLOWO2_01_FULL_40_24]OGE66983.1 MAG: 50S ribosomal protein L11 [Candidatus Daviesbacteria bacterium RIFCSPLOWO2_02_FULL_40_8]